MDSRRPASQVHVQCHGGRKRELGAVGEPRSEARRQQLLTNRNMCTLANNFAAENITPVLDYGVFSCELVDLILAQLTARPVMVVMLAPGLKVCQDRNGARGDGERLEFDYLPLEADRSHQRIRWMVQFRLCRC